MAQTARRADGDRLESTRLKIGLLGPLVVSREGHDLGISGPKRRSLLILLALNAGRPLGRDQIVEALWPRRQTGREEATLRTHVSYLRDGVEPDRQHGPVVLLTHGQSYLLDADQIELDVDRFRLLVEEGRTHLESEPDRALALLDEALALWRGRPLQDVEYEDFAQDQIRHFERARVETVVDRAQALVAAGHLASAVATLEPLVRAEPEWEQPALLLMRALYGSGRQSDALRVARRHRRNLAGHGLEPSPRLVEIEDRILSHDPEVISPGDTTTGSVDGVRGYELRDKAGEGSVGVVYRAYQPSVGREVALKVIHPDLAGAADFVRRFANEAKLVGTLEHPHIVPLYDFWRDPTGAFLVMRWMAGGSLRDRIRSGLKANDLLRAFDQLADALSYAHSAGIVHRDVKPANVLFDGSGNAYLSDFGLATWGVETGVRSRPGRPTTDEPYASPEVLRGEGPTVASDIYALGSLLSEALGSLDGIEEIAGGVHEVARVATATNPADRFPDVEAFRRALAAAAEDLRVTQPRRVRRNPYKGLKPFDEGDVADFYGRDEFVDVLLDAIASRSLVAVVAASGTGKSSVVRAGLLPELRNGAIPGSEEWFVVTMVPGIDPFDEFQVGLRAAAMTDSEPSSFPSGGELRASLDAALDGPSRRAVLFIDQFEELFSSDVEPKVRDRFLDNLVDLATDPSRGVKTVVTLRADFSDRPLSHPRFGGLMAKASLMMAPMVPDELEDVIRLPAARVGIEVEPGLVSEVIRDLSDTPASLPLLQFVLTELFERRSEDRLTVHSYRALGGVRGVLESQAEASFNSLSSKAKSACRQIFLRMVQLGDHGEETRRRVPRTEMSGLGQREAVDEAVEEFTRARILTSDRDPVSRLPTVEVSHETVITRWTRLRVWLDESRADLNALRRLASAADTWTKSGEDPGFLLTGGPLAAAVFLSETPRVSLNQTESRFVETSRASAAEAEAREQERQRREADLEDRSRRRLAIGVGAAAMAAVVAILAGFAFVERRRADDLAAMQERQSRARELAAASIANLDSADPDLGLLLAIEAADLSVEAGEEVLPEVTEALHRAVIRSRPSLNIADALGDTKGEGLAYAASGSRLAYVTNEGTVAVIHPDSGEELFRTEPVDPPAIGVDFLPDENRFVSIHVDGVREWAVGQAEILRYFPHPNEVTTATWSDDGSLVAIGDQTGTITVYEGPGDVVATLTGEHEAQINSVDFDPDGTRVVSAGEDPRALVWDLKSQSVITRPDLDTALCVHEASWHPTDDEIVVTLCHGEAFIFDATAGSRIRPFSAGTLAHTAMVYDSSGLAVAGAGEDGFTRLFNTGAGGSAVIELPNGGAPLDDVEFNPRDPAALEVATLGLNGTVQVWRDGAAWSEIPHLPFTGLLNPFIDATPDGRYYVFGANSYVEGWHHCDERLAELFVVEAATDREMARLETFCSIGWRHRATITDDGRLVAGTAPSGNVFIFDVESRESTEIPDSAEWTLDLDFSSDGRTLAGVGLEGSVALWDVESLREMRVMNPRLESLPDGQELASEAGPSQVEFLPGTDELVTAGSDGSVRLWEAREGSNRALEVFDFRVNSIDVSTDGTAVVAADRTGNVRVIDIASGDEILPRPQKVSGPTSVVFSPDGRHLAGGGPGPVVHLWDMETGEIRRRIGHAIGVPTVAFVNGGEEIRAASAEGIVRGYVLDPIDLLEIAQQKVGREMTEEECQRYLRRGC